MRRSDRLDAAEMSSCDKALPEPSPVERAAMLGGPLGYESARILDGHDDVAYLEGT